MISSFSISDQIKLSLCERATVFKAAIMLFLSLCLTQDLITWGYQLDKHFDEFEDFVRISKDSRILDVAAGTGLIGQKVKTKCFYFD